MKSPAFSFYVRDWLCSNTVSKLHSKSSSINGSNLCSRGLNAYIFLLAQAWLQEPRATLPDDDTELADLARVSPEEWSALKPLIMPSFLKNNEGRFFNPRQMEESNKQDKRKVAGSIGGSKKVANGVAALEIEIANAFESFWIVYPRKTAKGKAFESWCKIENVQSKLQKILSAVESQKKSDQWKKDNGQFIPYPATWLNQVRWDDEGLTLTQSATPTRKSGELRWGKLVFTKDNPPQRKDFGESDWKTVEALYQAEMNKMQK